MYEIGLSSCGRDTWEDMFRMYNQSAITAVEISPKDDGYDAVNYKAIKRYADQYNIKLWSFHLPFWPFSEIDLSNKDICKGTLEYFEELIKKASAIGIDKFTVHPSGEPIEVPEERIERMKCSRESLAKLAHIAKKYDAVIAVEDLPRSCLGNCSGEIMELISDSDDLMVCLDTNHLLFENPADFIRKVGSRIITTHISDCDLINERHWLPGEGKLDWQAILQALKDIDYKGPWLYEIGFKCPKSIIRDRDLTCDDFVRNAKEIFEGKPITTFSTHIENLGMWV
ncbi:MAG: sugar phosphate isomerase/epimerase [Clostridia bacterium]|nr:sugar phosphate isomerase/epimerase [Clostridia bacterium]